MRLTTLATAAAFAALTSVSLITAAAAVPLAIGQVAVSDPSGTLQEYDGTLPLSAEVDFVCDPDFSSICHGSAQVKLDGPDLPFGARVPTARADGDGLSAYAHQVYYFAVLNAGKPGADTTVPILVSGAVTANASGGGAFAAVEVNNYSAGGGILDASACDGVDCGVGVAPDPSAVFSSMMNVVSK